MARYALVIGIAKYKDRRLSALPKALTDAEQVAQLLGQHGEFQSVDWFPKQGVTLKAPTTKGSIAPPRPKHTGRTQRSRRKTITMNFNKGSGHRLSQPPSTCNVKRRWLPALGGVS